MELPFADWKYPRLSTRIWIAIFRLLWFAGYSRHCASFRTERKRVRSAADYLTILAKEQGSVMLVGHGILNRFIAGELLSADWRGPKTPGNTFWQYGTYIRNQSVP